MENPYSEGQVLLINKPLYWTSFDVVRKIRYLTKIKKEGKRVYELARRGVEVKLEPRSITISEFELVNIDLPVVSFRVVCSTGTYIRSLANDFGSKLGCGGYLSSLCRTRIGRFTLK